MTDPQPPAKPPFGKKRRRLDRPQVRVDAAAPATQKRSMLLSPGGIGTMAAIGVGALVVTNGFGGGETRRDCTIRRVATSQAQCEAIQPGAQCTLAFAGGAAAAGLSRTGSSGPWSIQPLTAGPGSLYRDRSGQLFSINQSCSTRASRSLFWGGRSSVGGSSSGYSSGQSQGVMRSGFGSTARSFSGFSSRGG